MGELSTVGEWDLLACDWWLVIHLIIGALLQRLLSEYLTSPQGFLTPSWWWSGLALVWPSYSALFVITWWLVLPCSTLLTTWRDEVLARSPVAIGCGIVEESDGSDAILRLLCSKPVSFVCSFRGLVSFLQRFCRLSWCGGREICNVLTYSIHMLTSYSFTLFHSSRFSSASYRIIVFICLVWLTRDWCLVCCRSVLVWHGHLLIDRDGSSNMDLIWKLEGTCFL